MSNVLLLENDFCFVFDRKSNISYSLFANVLNKSNTYELYYSAREHKSKFGKFWNRYLRRFIFAWIRKDISKKYYNKIIVFTNESLSHISKSLLKKMKKHSRGMVLFFIDEFFNDYKTIRRAKKMLADEPLLFDLVYTFTPKDVSDQGFKLTLAYYSKFTTQNETAHNDVFFLGSMKNRGALLDDIYNYFKQIGVNSLFYVYVNSPKDKTNAGFVYDSMPYSKSIGYVKSSNVILDLVDERQTGMTLRYYEAIVYNKKLLTNNKNIVKMPYFNPKYMKVFQTVDDIKSIEHGWFNTVEEIDYKYNGEYEPINFLKQIKNDLADEAHMSV